MNLISECINVDMKGMLECLTGIGAECCYVLGFEGCTILIEGQPITIF
jgi:hypothetical protein